MSHLALNGLIVCVSASDWTVTPLLRCASIGQSGTRRRQAVDPSRAGGETHHTHTSHHERISSFHRCCSLQCYHKSNFSSSLIVIKSPVSNFSCAFSRASGVGHLGAWWTSLQRCFSVWTSTAFRCSLCGWRRLCSLLVSRHHGSQPNRKTTSHIRYSGNTAGHSFTGLSANESIHLVNHMIFHIYFMYFFSCVVQRTSEQEEGEGHSEGVHTTVPRAPWYRVRRWILKLYLWTLT